METMLDASAVVVIGGLPELMMAKLRKIVYGNSCKRHTAHGAALWALRSHETWDDWSKDTAIYEEIQDRMTLRLSLEADTGIGMSAKLLEMSRTGIQWGFNRTEERQPSCS